MLETPWSLISSKKKFPENYNKLYDFMKYMHFNTRRKKMLVFVDSQGTEEYHDLDWNIEQIHYSRKQDKLRKITDEEATQEALEMFIGHSIKHSDTTDCDRNGIVRTLEDYTVKPEQLYDVRNIFTRLNCNEMTADKVANRLLESKTEFFITIKPYALLRFNSKIENSNIEFVGDMLDGMTFNPCYDYIIFEAEMVAPIKNPQADCNPNCTNNVIKIPHVSKKKLKKIRNRSVSEPSFIIKEKDEPQDEP